jgi:predicted MFS family arabinose efflux permease
MFANTLRKWFLSSYSGFSIKTWVTVLATFVNAAGAAVSIFIALYLSTVLHLPVKQVAYIVSASGLGAIIGAFISGYLCTKFDAYKMSIIFLIGMGFATCLLNFFSQPVILFILMLIDGFFIGAFRPANTLNLLQHCSVADRTKVNGLARVAVNLGMGIASVMGGTLALLSYNFIFWFSAITSWVAALILIYFSDLFKSATPVEKTKHESNNSLWSDKGIMFIYLFLLLNCLVFFQSWSTFPIYLNKYCHIGADGFGYLFLLNCLMIVFLEVPILNAIQHYNQLTISAIASIILCSSYSILVLSTSALIAALSTILLTVGEILLFSTVLILVINRCNEKQKGHAIGIYQTVFAASNLFAPLVGSFIYAKSPALLWYGCALVGIFCLIGFQLINLSWSKIGSPDCNPGYIAH